MTRARVIGSETRLHINLIVLGVVGCMLRNTKCSSLHLVRVCVCLYMYSNLLYMFELELELELEFLYM